MFHKNVTISDGRASGLGLEPGKMGLGGKRLVDAAHTVTVVKGRMEAHAFSNRFRQASAMACRSRAAVQRRKAAYASGGRFVSAP